MTDDNEGEVLYPDDQKTYYGFNEAEVYSA